MVCNLSFVFLSYMIHTPCMPENLILLIVFYSLDHLNKHFRSIVEKFEIQ